MGWLGNALIISGAWQIGYKRRCGFLIALSGSLFWIAEGSRLGMLDLICIEVIMVCVSLRNFWKWRKQ